MTDREPYPPRAAADAVIVEMYDPYADLWRPREPGSWLPFGGGLGRDADGNTVLAPPAEIGLQEAAELYAREQREGDNA